MGVSQRMYARALFEAARDDGKLGPVREQLDDLVAMVREVPQLRSVLENPEVDPAQKAQLLDEILGESEPAVRNFLKLLAEKGRSAEVEEIAREFAVLVAAEEKVLNVELTTAFELSDDEAAGIMKQIEDASGHKVDATRKVDPDLIGGLVLQAGSMRLDASVRGRLERLRHELVTARS